MEKQKKNSTDLKSPKMLIVLSLAVAAIGAVAPDIANASMPYYHPCQVGDAGDCEELTSSGTLVCTVGSFWNDCD